MAAKNPQDPTALFQEAMKNTPLDPEALKAQYKASAGLSERLAAVALEAAQRSNELSSAWTKETLANVGGVSRVKEDPSDFTEAMTQFASAQGDLASKNIAAFAEIAKTVQAQTIEIMMQAGQSFGADAAETMQKAADSMTQAGKAEKPGTTDKA